MYNYPRVIRNLSCTGGVNVKCYKRCNTNSYWAFDQTLYFFKSLARETSLTAGRLADEIQVNFEIFKVGCRSKYSTCRFV